MCLLGWSRLKYLGHWFFPLRVCWYSRQGCGFLGWNGFYSSVVSGGWSSFSGASAHGVRAFPVIVSAGESFSSLLSSKVMSWSGSEFRSCLLALAFTKIVVWESSTLTLELKLLILLTSFCLTSVAVGVSLVMSQAGALDNTAFSTLCLCQKGPRSLQPK